MKFKILLIMFLKWQIILIQLIMLFKKLLIKQFQKIKVKLKESFKKQWKSILQKLNIMMKMKKIKI